MKRILFTLVFISVNLFLQAQTCTPLTAVQCPDPEGNGEICPDWIILTEGVAYTDAMTILPPPTADGGVVGMVDVNWIQITAINNIPSGITYTCNPSDCKFNNGTYNCISMSGTPPVGSHGSYNLDIVLDANVTMQSFPYLTTTQSGQHENFRTYVTRDLTSHISIGNDTVIIPSAALTYELDTNRYAAIQWNNSTYNYKYTFLGSTGNGVNSLSVKALDTVTWNWVTDTVQITVSPNLGISGGTDKDIVTFYPNPTNSGIINIEFFENKASVYQVELFDMNSRLVMKTSVEVNGKLIHPMDISEMPKGVYNIRISNSQVCKSTKVVFI